MDERRIGRIQEFLNKQSSNEIKIGILKDFSHPFKQRLNKIKK